MYFSSCLLIFMTKKPHIFLSEIESGNRLFKEKSFLYEAKTPAS